MHADDDILTQFTHIVFNQLKSLQGVKNLTNCVAQAMAFMVINFSLRGHMELRLRFANNQSYSGGVCIVKHCTGCFLIPVTRNLIQVHQEKTSLFALQFEGIVCQGRHGSRSRRQLVTMFSQSGVRRKGRRGSRGGGRGGCWCSVLFILLSQCWNTAHA